MRQSIPFRMRSYIPSLALILGALILTISFSPIQGDAGLVPSMTYLGVEDRDGVPDEGCNASRPLIDVAVTPDVLSIGLVSDRLGQEEASSPYTFQVAPSYLKRAPPPQR